MSEDIRVDVPNTLQQLAPSATDTTSPQQPPNTAAASTMAMGNGHTVPSAPKWLLSNRPGRHDAARSSRAAARSASLPLLANGESISAGIDIGAATQTQTQDDRHLLASQHEAQIPPIAHQVLSSSSPSPALAPWPSEHPVACGAKRKANDAAPGDEERRELPLHRDGDRLKSRGGERGKIWINEDEGTRIRMEKTTALKSMTRRVTTSGGETHGHGKRAKRAMDTDDDTDTCLSWQRKIGRLPSPVVPSGRPRNAKAAHVDTVMDCVMPSQDLAVAAPSGGCGFESGIASGRASVGKVSDNLGSAMLVEDSGVVPPPDGAQPGSPGQSMMCEMSNEERRPWNTAARGPQCDQCESRRVHPPPYTLMPLDELFPNEFDDLDDLPDLQYPDVVDSAVESSDSGAPLAAKLSLPKPRCGDKGKNKARADRLDFTDEVASAESSDSNIPLALTVQLSPPKPRSRDKGENKARARLDFTDVEASRDNAAFGVTDILRSESLTTPQNNRSHNARGRRTKIKRNSDALKHAATPSTHTMRRNIPRAENPDTPESDDGSPDGCLVPRSRTARTTKRTNPTTWRVVEPPKNAIHHSAKRTLAPVPPGLRPRVWAGGKDELFAALPALAKNHGGVAWEGLHHPVLIFSEGKGDSSGLGWLKDDTWDGRKISFSIVREVHVPLDPPAVSRSESAAHVSSLEAGCIVNDTLSRPGTSLHLSTGFPEAGPSRPANHEIVQPLLLDALDVPSCGINDGKELDHRDGFMAELPLSTTDPDGHPQGHSSSIQPSAEQMRSPENSMPQADICQPSSRSINPCFSESLDANSIVPPDKSTSMLTPSDRGEGLHELPIPRPPPEVAALLAAQSAGEVVSPVFARNSPMVPWKLPSEIGHFWLGLFKISEVKVETCSWRNASNALTARHTWCFSLEWVPGGEDILLDDEQQDYHEWSLSIMRPWWEQEHEHVALELQGPPSFECSRLLLPLPLLAPFSGNSTASGTFPVGYFCATCGRVNVQRFLRHRVCESVACSAKVDPEREIGWVIGAFSTRDRKVNSATIAPDDKCAAPTTAELPISFEDGTRLFCYHLVAAPRLSDNSGDPIASPGRRSLADDDDDNSNLLSVRHIFNGNRASLQASASALFETLQRDVRIERNIGATVFSTPLFESGDDPALSRNGRGVWGQQAGIIEGAMRAYCYDLWPLRVRSLRIHAWISDGKHRQTFSSLVKHLVLLCLGADISLLSISSHSASDGSNSKVKKESLRVTMVHGDIVVLSGRKSEFVMVRTGMCMLLEAECI